MRISDGSSDVCSSDLLELERVADVLFHLPVTRIDRKTVAELDAGDAGRIVNIVLTPVEYRTGGPRSPFRVQVVDAAGNHASLVYFGKAQGWACKLLPIGEPRLVSGELELYGRSEEHRGGKEGGRKCRYRWSV